MIFSDKWLIYQGFKMTVSFMFFVIILLQYYYALYMYLLYM